jgi:hypothetical protein
MQRCFETGCGPQSATRNTLQCADNIDSRPHHKHSIVELSSRVLEDSGRERSQVQSVKVMPNLHNAATPVWV